MIKAREETGIREELVDELELPEVIMDALRWVGRHPGALLTGALVAGALAIALVQTLPPSSKADTRADEPETPLFI